MKRVLLFIMAACLMLSFAGCAVGADAGMDGVSVSAGPDGSLDNAPYGDNRNNVDRDDYNGTNGRITDGNDAPDGHISDGAENGALRGNDAARNNNATDNDGNNATNNATNNDGNTRAEEPSHNADNTGRSTNAGKAA